MAKEPEDHGGVGDRDNEPSSIPSSSEMFQHQARGDPRDGRGQQGSWIAGPIDAPSAGRTSRTRRSARLEEDQRQGDHPDGARHS